MRIKYRDDRGGRPKDRRVPAAVGLGMALFIAGFVLAITSLSEPSTASVEQAGLLASGSDAAGFQVTLVAGLLLSFAGIVLATAVPAMLFIQARKDAA